MKTIGLLVAALIGVSGQSPAAAPLRHLEYQFGYNTPVASSGQGTGTTAIDILGPAQDGGMMVSGTDSWWNSVRPRSTNTCEVYSDGGISCMTRPYAISPIQLAIFSLLGGGYFKGLSAGGTSTWKQQFQINRGDLYKWNSAFTLQGKGPIPNGGGLVRVDSNGTMDQLGGHYRQGTAKVSIAYDPVAKVPAVVDDLRTHLPQTSIYNQDLVQLKLIKDSQSKS
ncbi:MAG: hypothetical protein WB615_11870 [Candidatus Tumulicola sp.]